MYGINWSEFTFKLSEKDGSKIFTCCYTTNGKLWTPYSPGEYLTLEQALARCRDAITYNTAYGHGIMEMPYTSPVELNWDHCCVP